MSGKLGDAKTAMEALAAAPGGNAYLLNGKSAETSLDLDLKGMLSSSTVLAAAGKTVSVVAMPVANRFVWNGTKLQLNNIVLTGSTHKMFDRAAPTKCSVLMILPKKIHYPALTSSNLTYVNTGYGTATDTINSQGRAVITSPLTNFNVFVLDQNLKNNSSITFTNTNVWRSGHFYDANVTGLDFNFNSKNNNYFITGYSSISAKVYETENNIGHEAGIIGLGFVWR